MRWLRKLLGGRDDSYPDPPGRLINIPEEREPSPDLLRRLREFDPRAEVFYAGHGVWYVGRVKPNSPRRINARSEILSLRKDDGFPDEDRMPEMRQAILKEQGFGVVVREVIRGEPDDILVGEFAKAMFVERGGEIDTEEKKEKRARRSRQRSMAQRDVDTTREEYFRARGNIRFAVRRANTGR